MPSGTPWSVKGIDPRARAMAKTAARREGMTLGEWLNRVILDDGDTPSSAWDDQLEGFPGFNMSEAADSSGQLQAVIEALTGRMEASERRSTLALSGIDQSLNALTRRLDALEDRSEEDTDSFEATLARTRSQHEELLERIRKLERGGPGGADPSALKAVETTLSKLAGRLFETEQTMQAELENLAHREQDESASIRKALKSVKSLAEQVTESERRIAGENRDLRERLEADLRQRVETSDREDNRLRSMQTRIVAAETATHRAAEALAQSQERLDARLRTLEARTGEAVSSTDINARFEHLGRELAELIRDTRADCAHQIEQASLGLGDPHRFEQALSAAERRQSDTLERIGAEVGRLARAVDRRIEDAERRLERKFSESEHRREGRESRTDIENRLERVREENTVAVRRIGEQMARLGESLADRVHQAETRSAEAVEKAGERMAQVVEKLESKRSSEGDLDSRIRASEERTAQRITQAMEGVHARLDQARTETADALSPVQRAMSALADRLEAIERGGATTNAAAPSQIGEDPAAPQVQKPVQERPLTHARSAALREAESSISMDPSEPLPQPPGLREEFGDWDQDPGLAHDQFVIDGETARTNARTPDDIPLDRDDFGDTPPDPRPRQARPRPAVMGATADADFLASARKTVRANGHQSQWSPPPEPGETRGNRRLLIGASLLGFVAVAAAAGMLAMEALHSEATPGSNPDTTSLSSLFSGPTPSTSGQAQPTTLAPGDPSSAEPPITDRPAQSDGQASQTPPVAGDDTPLAGTTAQSQTSALPPPQAAVDAGADTAIAEPDLPVIEVIAPTLRQAATAGDPIARFQLALEHLSAGETTQGLARLRQAADAGIPEAMRQYGLMMARGQNMAADPAAGRAMVTAAAEAGNVQAMYDAASMFISVEGEPQAEAQAARWFEQGALHGMTDSQFNIALLFQEGFGVAQSPTDAYAWFSIAAQNGDTDAAQRAAALRPDLTPEQRAAAEQAARDFTPRPVDPIAQGQYPTQPWQGGEAVLIAQTQTLLAELGYDPGPADGVMGDRTRRAIVTYQRDTGLEPGSPVDPRFVARLEQSAAS